MKKLLSLFAAVALLFAATACSDGSSDDDAPGSSADVIVGTWEGTLSVSTRFEMEYNISITFKEDHTYTHTLSPHSSHLDSIGPGKWSFANNVVTLTPDEDPKDKMKAKYDPNAGTLKGESDGVILSLTKKNSSNGNTPETDSGNNSGNNNNTPSGNNNNNSDTNNSSDAGGNTTPGSDSGFTGGNDGIRIGNYALDFDDGSPIAVFAYETTGRYEAYKMCFYSDKTVKVRVTPVVQMKKTKGKRYDYMTGTYEGDPTTDGDISISFSKRLDEGYLIGLGTVKYENYDGTVPNTVTISDGKFTFKEKASSWGNEFLKTTKEDLSSYLYCQTDREDVNATEIVIPEGYSKIPLDCFRNNSKLAKLTVSSTVKEIYYPFYYDLKNFEIVYNGTKENWKKIKVCGYDDDYKTVKITCTDGELKFSSIERDFYTGKSYVIFEDK